jgi:uncharacterized protein YdaU (DUF1376 family)
MEGRKVSKESKRKAPAFQLYTDDFLAGTLEMSQEEVGQFIRLLCHQWNRGWIPVETEKQQRLTGGCVSVDVLVKFRLCEDGFLRNERLESVRTERGIFLQQQSKKGQQSAEKRRLAALEIQPELNRTSTEVQPDTQPNGQPTPQPESNSPSPSPSPIIKIQADKPPSVRFQKPTVEELTAEAIKIGLPLPEVDKFLNYYESNGWKVGKNSMKSWPAAMKGWLSRIGEASGLVGCKGAASPEVDWRKSI